MANFSAPWQVSIGMILPILLIFAAVVAAEDSHPQFEVASVRLNHSGTGVDHIRNVHGTFEVANVSLKRLVAMAWRIPDSREYPIRGPEWIGEENFDISARYPADTAHADTLLMLQRLLEERFHLALRHETREVSGYALTIAKGGPKLTRSTDGPNTCGMPHGGFRVLDGHAMGCAVTMAALADRLSRSSFGLDRPVIDATGIAGTYDVTLDFSDPSQAEETSMPSVVTAVQEQLGLRLEARRIPLDVLVIEGANKVPEAN